MSKENYPTRVITQSGGRPMRPGISPNVQAEAAHLAAARRGLPSATKVTRDEPNLTGCGTVRQVSKDEQRSR